MAFAPITEKRHGKTYQIFKGVNPDTGERENYFETDDEPNKYGLKTRWWFDEMNLKAKDKGVVIQIVTTWKKALVSTNGQTIEDTAQKMTMITRDYDLVGFLMSPLADPISIYLQNGAWKSERIMGHTHLKPFNSATGQVIAYSEFQKNAADPLPNSLDEFYVPPVEGVTEELENKGYEDPAPTN